MSLTSIKFLFMEKAEELGFKHLKSMTFLRQFHASLLLAIMLSFQKLKSFLFSVNKASFFFSF